MLRSLKHCGYGNWSVTSARSVSHPPGQLNILGHDGDHLGVDSAEIDVLEQGAGSMREEVLDQVFVEHPHSSPNLKHPEG